MAYKIIQEKKQYLLCICGVALLISQLSCKKYLEKKPSQNLAIPSTLTDLQAVLDNQVANGNSAKYAEFVADNYYLTTASWNGLKAELRKTYTWDKDAVVTVDNSSWSNPYSAVYQANFVLDILPKINVTEAQRVEYNNIKGSALFYRAFMFYQLAQLYCKPYSNSAATDPGIVVRITSDIEAPIVRSTVQQAYNQIIADGKEAIDLLPVHSSFSTRPNKAAAYGLLSRVYLSMRDYINAEINANEALNLADTLLDYNSLLPNNNPSLPFNPLNNPEILYLSVTLPDVFNPSHIAIVDSILYQSYDANDLRKKVFYGVSGGNAYWKGSYYANANDYSIFDGIATDEIYLNRAECRARLGNISGAMSDLNAMLSKRWATGTFTNLSATNSADALDKILIERRKELAFRGIRWSDLRRLNLEGAGITLKRIINGSLYTLPPNDLRWVLLIPEVEINRSGIPQNPR